MPEASLSFTAPTDWKHQQEVVSYIKRSIDTMHRNWMKLIRNLPDPPRGWSYQPTVTTELRGDSYFITIGVRLVEEGPSS